MGLAAHVFHGFFGRQRVTRAMILTTEDMGDFPDVDATTLDDVLTSDAFGKFAILSTSADNYIQAGNDWQPGPECKEFMYAHDSDPWVLEYREGTRQFRAASQVTLHQVHHAFRSYLDGQREWQAEFEWTILEL